MFYRIDVHHNPESVFTLSGARTEQRMPPDPSYNGDSPPEIHPAPLHKSDYNI